MTHPETPDQPSVQHFSHKNALFTTLTGKRRRSRV
jgi:hypothetical protein